MYKLVAVVFVVLLSAGASRLQAQSLKNTAWKFYVEPLHDTLTMHIGSDTSYCSSSSGEMVVQSLYKVAKDTIKLRDIGGEYSRTRPKGNRASTDYIQSPTFFLITDPCPNRSSALVDVKFKKTAAK